MRISVNIGGSRRQNAALRKFAKRGNLTANYANDRLSERLLQIIQELITTGPKTGRVYTRSRPQRRHQASAPGQAPANDLGTLANSFVAQQRRINQYVYQTQVGSNLVYAAALQYGMPDKNLLPRPYFDVAIRKLRREADGIVADSWRRTG